MSLRRKLSLSAVPPEVELHIPDNSANDVVRGAAQVAATVQQLLDERNDLLKQVEVWRQRAYSLRDKIAERDAELAYWRSEAKVYIHHTGELTAEIAIMLRERDERTQRDVADAVRLNAIIQTAKAVADQMTPPAPEPETVNYNGDHAPEPSLEEVHQIAQLLASQ